MKKFKNIFYLLLLVVILSNPAFGKADCRYNSGDSDPDCSENDEEIPPTIHNFEEGANLINHLMEQIHQGNLTFEQALDQTDLFEYPSEEFRVGIIITISNIHERYTAIRLERENRQQTIKAINSLTESIKNGRITYQQARETITNSIEDQTDKANLLYLLRCKWLSMSSGDKFGTSIKRKRN